MVIDMKKTQEVRDLPNKLLPFIWKYLRDKKWCLLGITFVAFIHSIEISLNPFLLKVLINTVIQYSHDQSKLMGAMTVDSALNPPKPREEFVIKQKAA
jgi:ATP-binding cassette subfamily B protein